MKRIQAKNNSGFTDFSGTMTDMCFLLIVFFLIAAAFVSDLGLLLSLPDPDSGPRELTPEKAVVIGLSDLGYSVDGIFVPEPELAEFLRRTIAAKNPEAVIIEPDSGVKYARVLKAMETAKTAGGQLFSIMSKKNPVPIELLETRK